MKKAFTLVELIFVIVIIGVLSAVAIPQFSKLTDNAKISAELSTASSIQAALEGVHGEWVISSCDFTWGNNRPYSELNSDGYPTSLGESNTKPLNYLLKNAEIAKWTRAGTTYLGPASSSKGTSHCKDGKPCIGKSWSYNENTGEFKLIEP
ncbi:MAG: prepilin-type cleavage/methylation domain-containing protein [Arcobacter sp.]|nr:MAG: prepilin-type cleavage/methylation domain-containing protein [Arcobacter sp.]